ncbi:MAG TPA: hypothetical protein VIU82_12715 [Bosea sp. (in: a-proteobacteria)]
MDAGVLAAIRLLPKHKRTIEELVLGNESFRTLCGDLAEAEQALRRWQKSGVAGHAARCLEYRHLIDGLEAELRQVVREREERFGKSDRI